MRPKITVREDALEVKRHGRPTFAGPPHLTGHTPPSGVKATPPSAPPGPAPKPTKASKSA